MKNSMQPEEGLVTITMTPAQLDVIMCQIEAMWDGDAREHEDRSVEALAVMVESGVKEWNPNYDYRDFGVDALSIAPVYRQMLDAWHRVGAGIGRNKGNEFTTVFAFARAVKAARQACGGSGGEVAYA